MDLPLYTTDSRSELSDQGRAAYQTFQLAVVLDQVIGQAGQDPEQVRFRDILLRLRDAKVTVADWNHLMTRTPTRVQDLSPFSTSSPLSKLWSSTTWLSSRPVASPLPPSMLFTLDRMQPKPQLTMQEDWRQSSAWTSGLTLALSTEPWELSRPSATGLEDHLTCPLLSWSALTSTPAPLFQTAQYPSLLFAAPGPPREVSAHVSSCPSRWRGQSLSTNLRVLPWTKWSSMLARESFPQASHLLPAHVCVNFKISCSPRHFPSNGSQTSPKELTSEGEARRGQEAAVTLPLIYFSK